MKMKMTVVTIMKELIRKIIIDNYGVTYESDCSRKQFSSHFVIYCLLLIPVLIVYILLYCKRLVSFFQNIKC